MGSGRQRKRNHGRRPNRPKQAAERLTLLCDQHLERSLRELINGLPGYRAESVTRFGLSEAKDAGAIRDKAIELRAVILTRDTDFLDPVYFPPGQSPGVICVRLPYILSELRPRIEAFFRSPRFYRRFYRRCKRSIVQLTGDLALFQSHPRGETVSVRYYPPE